MYIYVSEKFIYDDFYLIYIELIHIYGNWDIYEDKRNEKQET